MARARLITRREAELILDLIIDGGYTEKQIAMISGRSLYSITIMFVRWSQIEHQAKYKPMTFEEKKEKFLWRRP